MPESLFEKVGARHDPYVTSTPSHTASQECCTPAAQGIGAERVPGAAQGPAQRHALYVPTAVSELEEELVRSLAQVLGVEESDINGERPFREIGLDSITGVEWIQALNKQYSLSLSTTRVYDYPTIHAFADFLFKEGGGSFGRVHPQEFTQGRGTQAPFNPGLHVPEWPEEADFRVPLQEETSRGSGPPPP